MGALIRPRGCSKAEEAHQNIIRTEEAPRVTSGKSVPWLHRKGNPGDSPGTHLNAKVLPAAPTLSHLSASRCPLLLLRQPGCHQLVQLLHGQAGQGPPGSLDLLQDAGQLGPAWTAASKSSQSSHTGIPQPPPGGSRVLTLQGR